MKAKKTNRGGKLLRALLTIPAVIIAAWVLGQLFAPALIKAFFL